MPSLKKTDNGKCVKLYETWYITKFDTLIGGIVSSNFNRTTTTKVHPFQQQQKTTKSLTYTQKKRVENCVLLLQLNTIIKLHLLR